MQVVERRVEVESGVSLATWLLDGRDRRPDNAPETATQRHGTFLLVHGLASNAQLWDMTALELTRLGHLVAAVDLRGHGRSDKPAGTYDFSTLVADIVTVSNALELNTPVLTGQSLGANLVLEAAWADPGFSRGIACVDGGTIELSKAFPDWETVADVLAPPKLIGTDRSVIEKMLRDSHPTWPESGIQATMANFMIRDDDTIAPQLSLENHMKILRSLWEHRPSSRFASLKVPAIFIFAGGTGSGPMNKHEAAATLKAENPSVRVHWFDEADHDIHAQHPVELATLLDAQIQEGFFAPDPPEV